MAERRTRKSGSSNGRRAETSRATVKRAREIVREELRALELTLAAIDARFARAVEVIASAKGKLVVTGVGKSGLIGQKIVATLNSTGATAVFMHGADGVHGDLGVVKRIDAVLALSYSGATLELLANLPTIQRIGAKVVAMVGDLKSPLARAADAVIPVVIDREACMMNLAPTSSTTAMMALGDALALILSERRRFRPEDFALYHPGGALGRRLLLRVGDLMHGGKANPMALPATPVKDIAALLTETRLGGVNIVKDLRGRRLVGIITDGDVRLALARESEFFALTARDVMTADPVSIRSDMLAADALELMENRRSQISVLPVVDARGRAEGMIRLHDLLQVGQR
jgi:arabinose-5-phosphate isomerase